MSFDAEGEKLSCSTISADLDASTSLPFFLVLYNSFFTVFYALLLPAKPAFPVAMQNNTNTNTNNGRSELGAQIFDRLGGGNFLKMPFY